MKGCGRIILPVFLAIGLSTSLSAQGYRARLDIRAQEASFRGVTLDSVPIANTVVGPTGGLTTTDGFAVHCPTTTGLCYFYRPGPVQRGGPMTATVDLSLWGLGLPGLSAHIVSRAGTDVGGTDTWPGNQPNVQLLEGYADRKSVV